MKYGKKYCRHSPVLKEGPIQQTILEAINRDLDGKDALKSPITEAMVREFLTLPYFDLTMSSIDLRLKEPEGSFNSLFTMTINGNLEGFTAKSSMPSMRKIVVYLHNGQGTEQDIGYSYNE